MKKAVVLEGPGFSDFAESQKILEGLGFKVEPLFLGYDGSNVSRVWPDCHLLVLRGPWKLCSEEALLVNAWVRKWRGPLEQLLQGKNPKTTVVGLGRGALMLFQVLAGSNSAFSDWAWESVLEDEGPWVDTQIEGHTNLFKSLFYDHFRPELTTPALFQMEPWIKVNENILGWKMQKHVYMSLLDIFAFQDRAQHADFGYADLSQLSMPQDLFAVLFPGV